MKNRQRTDFNDELRFLSPGYLKPYLLSFTKDLSKNGHTTLTIEGYYSSVAHFGTWLQKKHILLKGINDKTITTFEKHRCDCPGGRRIKKMSRRYLNRVRCFVFYLQEKGVIVLKKNTPKTTLAPLCVKFINSLYCRDITIITIKNHERAISKLLPLLGSNPKKYNAETVRQVIYNIATQNSLAQTKKLTTTLKAYLRFLAVEGMCTPDLDTAVPIVAQWKLSSLPKYITEDKVNLVIASCDARTQHGLRDKAILLLLARLGLRAGDIINMLIDDVNWEKGTLRVRGKGRKEVILPLPQDVGDALLAYIEKGRQKVSINQIFLCLNAPYRPFRFSNSISNIVEARLSQAGIADPPSRGAHLLRHSAATTMLRNGASLENVSAVLRHASLDMTAYYAKVNIHMLMQITQPWPEGAPC